MRQEVQRSYKLCYLESLGGNVVICVPGIAYLRKPFSWTEHIALRKNSMEIDREGKTFSAS